MRSIFTFTVVLTATDTANRSRQNRSGCLGNPCTRHVTLYVLQLDSTTSTGRSSTKASIVIAMLRDEFWQVQEKTALEDDFLWR